MGGCATKVSDAVFRVVCYPCRLLSTTSNFRKSCRGLCCPSIDDPKRCMWVFPCCFNKKYKELEEMDLIEGQFYKGHTLVLEDGPPESDYLFPCETKICGRSVCKRKTCGYCLLSCCNQSFSWLCQGWCSWCSCFKVNPMRRVVIMGMPKTGKTRLLRKLLVNVGDSNLDPGSPAPTLGYVSTNVTFNIWQKYEVFDVGGTRVQRQFWSTYYDSMVRFDTVVYAINANSFLESNFDEQVVERERQAIHTLLASPVLRQSEFICYFSFPKNLNLGFMQESEVTNEILVRLGLRKTDKADTTPTKFPQQRIKVITDYKALLHSIGVDTNVHKILAPKRDIELKEDF